MGQLVPAFTDKTYRVSWPKNENYVIIRVTTQSELYSKYILALPNFIMGVNSNWGSNWAQKAIVLPYYNIYEPFTLLFLKYRHL